MHEIITQAVLGLSMTTTAVAVVCCPVAAATLVLNYGSRGSLLPRGQIYGSRGSLLPRGQNYGNGNGLALTQYYAPISSYATIVVVLKSILTEVSCQRIRC